MILWVHHITHNTFFIESQDLRERVLYPGLTVGDTDIFPKDIPPEPQPSEPMSPSKVLVHRSVCISNMSEDILREKSSTYTQFYANGKDPENIPLPTDAGCTPDGYVHFTFDDNKWCNLSNEDNPVSYKDAFSQLDAPQWQAAYEDEMWFLCEHKVWDLIP